MNLTITYLLFLLGVTSVFGFGDNPYYFKNWCGSGLQYLDDSECQKKFPSTFDREWSCPNRYSNIQGYNLDGPLKDVVVDTHTLSNISSLSNVEFCLIMVKRTDRGIYFKYLSPGNHNQAFETWSSSKIFAMANAASHMEDTCSFGLSSETTGKHGKTPLGDLATIVCSYDTTQGYTSNALGRYFNDVGGRKHSLWLIQDWLQRTNETLGGNYGQPTPQDLGFDFNLDQQNCAISPDHSGIIIDNTLSTLTMAEYLKRIVLYRESIPQNRVPQMKWSDCQDEMYGAETSLLFPGLQWGGMTSDTAIFLQSGVENMTIIDNQSQGKWRIFSKLGDGYDSGSNVGDIVSNAYACFPVLSGSPVLDEGVEFFFSARASVSGDSNLEKAQTAIQTAISDVVGLILQGRIK